MIGLEWGALSIFCRAPRPGWSEGWVVCAFEGARNRRRKAMAGERKSRIRIPKKSGERVFEADSLMKIDIFVPAWRPRSVPEMHSERVASILLRFALLCTALLCVAPLGFAWCGELERMMECVRGPMTISEIPEALPAAQEGPQAVISVVPRNSHIPGANRLGRGGRRKMRPPEWGALTILLPRASAWLE